MSWTPRAWPLALLAFSLLPACTTDDTEDTAGESGANDVTTAPSTADETATAGESATSVAESGDDSAALGCAAGANNADTDGASNPIMDRWGAACSTNEDCIDLIGDPAAVCDFSAVVFELPGGYCTKPCTLPDLDTRAVPDDPQCDPAGGVTCLGVMGTFERCAIPCTDGDQCNRNGYFCRQLPLIAQAEDPSFCLMPDCCQDTCEE